jgi:type I restriction enzyme S subunit
MSVESLITQHLDIWTSAIKTKSAAGRGSSKKLELVGVKKLRELILELAVRGKLVPQDPSDEPASELLKKIAAERAQLVLDGKINKQKPLPTIAENEKPFELPEGWEWTFLGELSSNIHYGYTASAEPENKGIRLLRITDIQEDKVNWKTVPGCEITDKKSEGYLLEDNDILIARTGGTIGKSYLVENIDVRAVFASYLIRVKRISAMYSPYIKTYLGSAVYWKQLYDNAAGTGQPNVNATALKQLLVPIPKLEEQHRIVAKVDELMALCDQIEAQTEASIDAHKTLVEVLLATLTDAKDADELNDNWQTISQHFDVLFTTQASIDHLKQTILQLAVMGKLVKQDPKDEPACKLLERIATEKQQLIKVGKIKKQKLLAPITNEEKPFELPAGWEWVCWAEILAYDNAAFKRGPFGSSLTKSMFISEGYKVYEQYCPINDDCSFERYYISDEKFKELEGFAVKEGDFLVSCTGATLGRITQVPSNFKEGIINQALLRVRINNTYIDSEFFKLLFRSPYFQKSIFANSKGSAIPNVKGVGDLKVMLVPFLPFKEQQMIVAKVDELMALCDSLKTNLSQAQTTQLHLTDAIVEQAL